MHVAFNKDNPHSACFNCGALIRPLRINEFKKKKALRIRPSNRLKTIVIPTDLDLDNTN